MSAPRTPGTRVTRSSAVWVAVMPAPRATLARPAPRARRAAPTRAIGSDGLARGEQRRCRRWRGVSTTWPSGRLDGDGVPGARGPAAGSRGRPRARQPGELCRHPVARGFAAVGGQARRRDGARWRPPAGALARRRPCLERAERRVVRRGAGRGGCPRPAPVSRLAPGRCAPRPGASAPSRAIAWRIEGSSGIHVQRALEMLERGGRARRRGNRGRRCP